MIKQNVIDRAIKVAKQSTVARGRVGAVLFIQSGQIITATCNKNIYGKQDEGIFTIHAEKLLLAKAHKLKAAARFGIPNLSILVVRWKPSIKRIDIAKPCVPCEFLMREAGINNIYYSDGNGEIIKLKKEAREL